MRGRDGLRWSILLGLWVSCCHGHESAPAARPPGPGEIFVSGLVVGPDDQPVGGVGVQLLAYEGGKAEATDTSAKTGLVHLVVTTVGDISKLALLPSEHGLTAQECLVDVPAATGTRMAKAPWIQLLDDPDPKRRPPLKRPEAELRLERAVWQESLRVGNGKDADAARADLRQMGTGVLMRVPDLDAAGTKAMLQSVHDKAAGSERSLLPTFDLLRGATFDAYLSDPKAGWRQRIAAAVGEPGGIQPWMVDYAVAHGEHSLVERMAGTLAESAQRRIATLGVRGRFAIARSGDGGWTVDTTTPTQPRDAAQVRQWLLKDQAALRWIAEESTDPDGRKQRTTLPIGLRQPR